MAKAKRTRRTFTLEEKQNILAEVEAGNKLVDVAKKYKMQPAQLSQWKSKYGGGGTTKKGSTKGTKRPVRKATTAAAPATTDSKAPAPRTTTPSNGYVAELERMVGQLTIENIKLRGRLGEL